MPAKNLILRACLASAVLALGCSSQQGPGVSLTVAGRASSTPSVAADGLFAAVAWGASTRGKNDVFVSVSRDAGATFAPPVQVNAIAGEASLGGERPPRVALTRRPGAADPDIVVLWTAKGTRTEIREAVSRDGGATFQPAVTLTSSAAAGDRGWPALAVDGQGTAHAIWLDHRGLEDGSKAGAHEHHQGAARDAVAMAQKSGLYYAAASAPVSPERELAKGVCYCCKTAFAAGAGGALYAAWRHVYPGNLRDIAFTASRDGGRSFSEPVRVSEDGWAIDACPDDGPAVVVDEQGTVHIAWPTVMSGAKPQGGIFYASSRDGRAFSPRVRVPTLGSPRPSHPQIALTGNGGVVIAWDELVDGRRVAAAREVKPRADGSATFGSVVRIGTRQAAMYPALATTASGVLAVWTAGDREDQTTVKALRLRMP
jgi:hypothetical protein